MDFVLFPSSHDPRSSRQSIERAQATSRVGPNLRIGSATYGLQQQNLRRNSANTKSTGQSPNPFYSTSAPTSSAALYQPRTRPPVPLFPVYSTGNMHHNMKAESTLSKGSSSLPDGLATSVLTDRNSENDLLATEMDLLDFTVSSDAHAPALPFSSADFDLRTDFGLFDDHRSMAHSESVQTVSPKDIMVDSAPPSTTFTNLTTPGTSYFDSPYLDVSSDTSPRYGADNLASESDTWTSLFVDDDGTNVAAPVHPRVLDVVPRMSRNGSSPGQALSRGGSNQGRHSSSSGVSSRRRDKPLPAITVDDPHDIVAVKRARNTLAARKSRQKRVEQGELLLKQVEDLELQVEYWKQIALGRGHVEQ